MEKEEKEAGLRACGWRGGEWERPGVSVQPNHLTKKKIHPTLPMNLSVYHLSKLFSGPPVEVKNTGCALQTDSPVITNVVLPDYQPIVGGLTWVK